MKEDIAIRKRAEEEGEYVEIGNLWDYNNWYISKLMRKYEKKYEGIVVLIKIKEKIRNEKKKKKEEKKVTLINSFRAI